MAEQMWEKPVWSFRGNDFINLRTADSGVKNSYKNLSDIEYVRKLDFIDHERFVGFREDRGLRSFNGHIATALPGSR
jgi:hypothetical protein